MKKFLLVLIIIPLIGVGCVASSENQTPFDQQVADDVPATPEPKDLTLEDMQVCEQDSDCVYADRSICPFTDRDNIVAINKNSFDLYMAEKTTPPVYCVTVDESFDSDPKCIQNKCSTPNEF